MAAPQTVLELIELYNRKSTAYRSREHTETKLRKIDSLVYELYGLTKDEIKMVEEHTRIDQAEMGNLNK